MTVETTLNKKIYVGDGSTVAFDFPYPFYDNTDLIVQTYLTATPDDKTTLTLGVDYTVSGGSGEDGTVTLTVALASGSSMIVYRELPLTQESDYTDYNRFPAQTVEDNLDRLTMLVQQLNEQVARATLADVTEDTGYSWPTPESNQYISWNAAADALVNRAGTGGGTWGNITGTLSDQLDLQAALDAKLASTDINTFAKLDAIVADKSLVNLEDGGTFTSDISVPDEAYGAGWNGSVEVPTKNAIYDKIETITGGEILGDGTAGRVLRAVTLTIADGTNPTTVKPSTANHWNGDVISAEDNLSKGGSTTSFSLSANGGVLTILNAAISGTAIAVLSADIGRNQSGTAASIVRSPSGGVELTFYNASSGALIDLTTAVDSGTITVNVTYLTSA